MFACVQGQQSRSGILLVVCRSSYRAFLRDGGNQTCLGSIAIECTIGSCHTANENKFTLDPPVHERVFHFSKLTSKLIVPLQPLRGQAGCPSLLILNSRVFREQVRSSHWKGLL